MSYIYSAAAATILIFILLILKKNNKNTADYLLMEINLLIGCFMLSDVLVSRELSSASVIFQNGVPLFLFPVFVLYVLQFTHARRGIKWYWYLTFLPGILFLIYSIIDHYILENYPTDELIAGHFNTPSWEYQLIFKGSQLLFIGIMIRLLLELNRFEGELKNGYSTIDTIDIEWLRNFTVIYLVSLSLTFVLFLSQNLGLLPFDIQQVFGIIYGVLVVSVFYMNYYGIQHYTVSQIDTGQTALGTTQLNPTLVRTNTTENVGPKPLTEEEEGIEQAMLNLIEAQQLYLEPKFGLQDLAEKLDSSTHTVSRIINAKNGRTFYDLINGYRVQHLQQLLNDPKNSKYTILALGLDSGFNSKASLNRIFKNNTGLTPRQYLDKMSQSAG